MEIESAIPCVPLGKFLTLSVLTSPSAKEERHSNLTELLEGIN